MQDEDRAPAVPPREIHLVWESGRPLTMELEGDFDEWEVRAALAEALAMVAVDEPVEQE